MVTVYCSHWNFLISKNRDCWWIHSKITKEPWIIGTGLDFNRRHFLKRLHRWACNTAAYFLSLSCNWFLGASRKLCLPRTNQPLLLCSSDESCQLLKSLIQSSNDVRPRKPFPIIFFFCCKYIKHFTNTGITGIVVGIAQRGRPAKKGRNIRD